MQPDYEDKEDGHFDFAPAKHSNNNNNNIKNNHSRHPSIYGKIILLSTNFHIEKLNLNYELLSLIIKFNY